MFFLQSCHKILILSGAPHTDLSRDTALGRRVLQYKEGTLEGFTADYGCKRLLYFEGYEDIRTAIAREKQLKGWRREKKLNLIRTINPEFKDLAQTWGWKMISVHEKIYP